MLQMILIRKKNELDNQAQNIIYLQEALESLINEYQEKVSVSEEEIAQLQSVIDELSNLLALREGKLSELETTLNEAQNQAQNDLNKAIESGYLIENEDGDYNAADFSELEIPEPEANEEFEEIENSEEIEEPEESDATDKTEKPEEFDETDGAEEITVTKSQEEIKSYAEKLYNSMAGWGTDEDSFYEVLADESLTDADWLAIIEQYNNTYDKSIMQAIDGDFSGSEQANIIANITEHLINAAENNIDGAINLLCSEIHNSTAEKLGTTEDFVNQVVNQSSPEILANIMDRYNDVTGSEILLDIQNDFSENIATSYTNKLKNAYKEVNETEYTGDDDGKLTNSQKTSTVRHSAWKKIKEQVSSLVEGVKEHPLATATIVLAAGAACIAFPIAAPLVLGAIGHTTAVIGGVKAGIEVKDSLEEYSNATSDTEAQEALEDAAGSGVEVVEDAALAALSAIQIGSSIGAMHATKAGANTAIAASSVDDAARSAASGVDDATRAALEATDDAIKAIPESIDDAARAGAESIDDAARNAAEATDDALKSIAESVDDAAQAAEDASQIPEKTANIIDQIENHYDDLEALIEEFRINVDSDNKTAYREICKIFQPDIYPDLDKISPDTYRKLTALYQEVNNIWDMAKSAARV